MENIELRSEKIRQAIGRKPSFFLRWGTVIITIVLIIMAIIVFTIK